MNDDRMRFLSRCSVSDIECCDSTFASLQHCAARRGPVPSEDRKACRWPEVAYSCDFCGTWPSFVTKCDSCTRWVGLSDCRCAIDQFRRPDGLYGQTIVRKSAGTIATNGASDSVDAIGAGADSNDDEDAESDSNDEEDAESSSEADRTGDAESDSDADDTETEHVSEAGATCRWCHCVLPDGTVDLTAAAPDPVGLTRGLLSRIVFVLEPQINANSQWHFNVSHWITEALLAQSGAGSIVVYGLPCDEGERAFIDAMALVQQFALDPRRFLPQDCRWASDECDGAPLPRISLVLATHTALVDNKPHLELGSPDTVRPIDWWCNALAQNTFSRRQEHTLRIDELHAILCNIFTAQGDVADQWQRFSDSCNVAVMAADGNAVPYLQSGLIAAHIVSRVHRRDHTLAAVVRRFQPHAQTLIMSAQRPIVDHFEHHSASVGVCGEKRKRPSSDNNRDTVREEVLSLTQNPVTAWFKSVSAEPSEAPMLQSADSKGTATSPRLIVTDGHKAKVELLWKDFQRFCDCNLITQKTMRKDFVLRVGRLLREHVEQKSLKVLPPVYVHNVPMNQYVFLRVAWLPAINNDAVRKRLCQVYSVQKERV